MITFADQSDVFIEKLRTRKRNPIKESSLESYRSYVRCWIIPLLGSTCLAEFTPVAMREFIAKLSVSLGPKSINEIVSLTKQIVASVVDENGSPVFRIAFDSEFIDLPIVDPRKQRTPIISREELERGIAESSEMFQCLYASLAGAGLRINEALALKLNDPTGSHSVFDAQSSTIHVRRGLFRGREQESPKTPSAIRSVEIPYALSAMLAKFAGSRSGYLFGNGTPTSETTARNHLAKQGLPGFHSFRRYFISYRRSQGMPEELLRSMVGHASSDITSRYSRFGTSAEFAAQRREIVEKIGLGFKLPSPRRNDD